MENLNFEKALNLLKEWVSSESLLKHSLAVAEAMSALAKRFKEDELKWKITGLLHDLDYEKYPEKHPEVAIEILREKGYPEDVILAIWGHFSLERKRESLMAKALFAVDELCGLALATALMRPQGFQDMKPKSLKKKMKDKSFAKGVNREHIRKGIEELGLSEDELFEVVIKALAKIQPKLLGR